MTMDNITQNALEIGRKRADNVIQLRNKALELRKQCLDALPKPITIEIESVDIEVKDIGESDIMPTAGVLVAEGDSWFNYPWHDVLKELEDCYGYDVESVAHYGDPIEEMAYGGGQLDELTRRIEKLLRRRVTPKAVLLSGGGNDVAGADFGMLLNHEQSPIFGLNLSILEGVINQRIRTAYITILSAVTSVCEQRIGNVIPILVHGYDYPVPDGRGFLGGWGFLPGPWLEPGFREKGYNELTQRIGLAHELIERFNLMIKDLVKLPPFQHVHYVDLRNVLQTGNEYKDWWANELHPTERGFHTIAEKFAATLASLP
ncbi:MAG: SGNH/GDSL hydrolase family protein [Dehalococcoidia bacterium]|nr:SGNH/GDSL hydrolase family protein [Dehalococcoidia bacterium]